MPQELPRADDAPRRRPTLAALRRLRMPVSVARPIPVEESADSQDAIVVPLRRETEIKKPEREPAPVRIPPREIRVEPSAAQPVSESPPTAVLPKEGGSTASLSSEAFSETRSFPYQSAPILDEDFLADLEAEAARTKVRVSPRILPPWYQKLLALLHLVPWAIFFAMAFRLFPTEWQFEQWPAEWQTGATAAFGIFILSDILFVVWYLAFRKSEPSQEPREE